MSQTNKQETKEFPLIQANAIIPTSNEETPSDVECIYIVIVDAPGQPRGQFGPVKAWRDTTKGPGVWRINAPHGIESIPSMKERLDNLVDAESWKVGDPAASLLSGMVKKNDYSWDSLVRAYSYNDVWAKNVIGLLQETFSQASMLWWVSLPSIDSDSARFLISLSEVDNERRVSLEDDVEGFMIASSVMEEYSSKSHNSSARKNAEYQLEEFTDKLRDALGDDLNAASAHEKTADDGTVFLR